MTIEIEDKDKTREQLINELATLRNRITALEVVEIAYFQLVGHLSERTKELTCIYSVAQIVDHPGSTLSKIYQQIVEVLPAGFKYPAVARARIEIDGKEFRSLGYTDTKWKLSTNIEVYNVKRGTLEVCYLEKKPEMSIGPFLNEEWLLLTVIAGRLGRLIERKEAG